MERRVVSDALAQSAEAGELAIDPIIYGEVSVRFSKIEDLEEALPRALFRRAPLPWEAAFLAAKAYVRYRRAGGERTVPLPDFFVGAHAAVADWTLLTRDAKRVRRYFPTVRLRVPPA
jgi:predicted nucleic acid-binding protein